MLSYGKIGRGHEFEAGGMIRQNTVHAQ